MTKLYYAISRRISSAASFLSFRFCLSFASNSKKALDNSTSACVRNQNKVTPAKRLPSRRIQIFQPRLQFLLCYFFRVARFYFHFS